MLYLENLELIRGEVARCGREVTLIAATKTQSPETVKELTEAAPDIVLGENRMQELLKKYDPAYRWHMIGQLQTNKVKYIIDKVELIHSLDRTELAREIEKQAAKRGKQQECLIEINMGSEISKGGISPENAQEFISSMQEFGHLKIKGIMSVMPNLGDTPELHRLYEKLEGLFEDLKSIKLNNVDIEYLSAGMSNDYKIALMHGSNMIRLGRALFGERV